MKRDKKKSRPRPARIPRMLHTMVLAALLVLAAAPVLAAEPEGQWQRPAALAGSWYPAEAGVLGPKIDAWLAAARPALPPGRLVAIVTPHAGHAYSGAVAGAAWGTAKSAAPAPQTVILVGPSHRVPLAAPGIWPEGAFLCPLGPTPVTAGLAASLSARLGAGPARQAHLVEHSLEVQLPFLRRALPAAALVPVLTGPPEETAARDLGRALAEASRGGRVLLAASTDLSHFHPREQARVLDDVVAKHIEALDAVGLLADLEAGRAEACGAQALVAVMLAARELGATRGVILARADSSGAGGEASSVVGYLAAALVAEDKPASPAAGLDQPRQARLRELAARAVAAAVMGESAPAAPQDDPELTRPAGVFVTLKQGGRLRGCIGTVLPRMPLARAVVEMAGAAALKDPRFDPVRPAELAGLSLELSVLTPFEPCAPEQVRVGVDGLMIEARGRAGLLLPQVPGEFGWNREQYLDQLCLKAGLPPGAWRETGVRLMRFQAQIF
jgi:AmmeMemoRadiSam system protein B/AmmeMemoRadiSam system protein A